MRTNFDLFTPAGRFEFRYTVRWQWRNLWFWRAVLIDTASHRCYA